MVTISELLSGKKPDVPTTISPYREAKPTAKKYPKLGI
jgi:hypothetical protein